MPYIILSLALLFFLSHFLNWVFIKTKIPDLLILVSIGYIIGPVLGIVTPYDFGKVGPFFSTTALIVILYEGGLNLKFSELKSSAVSSIKISVLSFLTVSLLSFVLIHFAFLQNLTTSLLVSLALGSTSSAIVIPLIKGLSLPENIKNTLSLESAFTDVLAIVLFLVVLDSSVRGSFDINRIFIAVGPNTLIAIMLGIASSLLIGYVKNRYQDILPKAFVGESWALVTYAVSEILGYNGAMSVLALGFALANINKHESLSRNLDTIDSSELSLLSEISFLLKTFFFIYLGILIQIEGVLMIILSLMICVLILITRFVSTRLTFRKQDLTTKEFFTCVFMGPRGLACSVLATLPLQYGFQQDQGQWIQSSLFTLIPFTILMTSVGLILIENKKVQDYLSNFFVGKLRIKSQENSDLKSLD